MTQSSPSPTPSTSRRYLAKGLLLLLAVTALTFIAWHSASGGSAIKVEVPPPKADVPTFPSDMEDQLAQAIQSPRIDVPKLLDPFVDRTPTEAAPPPKAAAPAPKAPPPIPDFSERYAAWRQAVKRARAEKTDEPDVTTVYLITELEPVGRVNVAGRASALLYIRPEKRTFAAPTGTRFYNAVLESITADGVRFQSTNGPRFVEWSANEEIIQHPARTQPSAAPDTRDPLRVLQDAVRDRSKPHEAPKPDDKPKQDPPSRSQSYNLSPVYSYARLLGLPSLVASSSSTYYANSSALAAHPIPAVYHRPPGGETPVQASFRQETKKEQQPPSSPKSTGSEKTSSQPPSDDDRTEGAPDLGATRPRQYLQSSAASPPTPDPSAQAAASPDSLQKTDGISTPPPSGDHASFCDPAYIGSNYGALAINRPITLLNFTDNIHTEFGPNFIVDPDIQDLPIRVSVTNAPWTVILRTVIELNDLSAVCQDGLIQIVSRTKLQKFAAEKRKSSPTVTKVFRLRYIQPNSAGTRNVAGQFNAGTTTLQTLEESVRKILHANGEERGDVSRVPGRNELIVAGSEEQIKAVTALIERVDRPTYQVEIHALIYTVNRNYIKDIGSQLSGLISNGPQTTLGGGTTLPNANPNQNGQTTGGNSNGASGRDPGGIPGLAANLRQPSQALGAANPLAIFGFTTIIGTSQFAHFITAAEQKGIANVEAKPFGTIADGQPLDIISGDEVPVLGTVVAGGTNVPSNNLQFLEANRVLRITPQVAEDDAGHPIAVTLLIQLEDNSVNTALPAFGGLPSLARQSIQTVIRLKDAQTGIIGGLVAKSTSRTINKVPLVADIPLVGNLFKRKTTQEDKSGLYFAISAKVLSSDGSMMSLPADVTTDVAPPGSKN